MLYGERFGRASAPLRVAAKRLAATRSGALARPPNVTPRHAMTPIYLDYNATTPIDPAVFAAMRPYLEAHYGNPSSAHVLGQYAHDAVEAARAQVAALLGAKPGEVVFTGGGTEASNHAIKGAVFARSGGGV